MQSKNQEKCDKKTIRLDKENRKKTRDPDCQNWKTVSRFYDPVEYEVCLVINFDPLLIYQKTLLR